jgi:hypothetical protein
MLFTRSYTKKTIALGVLSMCLIGLTLFLSYRLYVVYREYHALVAEGEALKLSIVSDSSLKDSIATQEKKGLSVVKTTPELAVGRIEEILRPYKVAITGVSTSHIKDNLISLGRSVIIEVQILGSIEEVSQGLRQIESLTETHAVEYVDLVFEKKKWKASIRISFIIPPEVIE